MVTFTWNILNMGEGEQITDDDKYTHVHMNMDIAGTSLTIYAFEFVMT